LVITAALASLTIIGCPGPNPDDNDTVYVIDTVIKRDTIITKDTIIRADTIITKDTIIDKDTVIVEDTIIVKDTIIVIDTIGKYYNYFSYIEFPETLMMWSQSAIRYKMDDVPNLTNISLGFFYVDVKGVLPVDQYAIFYNNTSASAIMAEEYVSGIFAPTKKDLRFYHMGGFSDYEGDNIEALWITPVSNKKEEIKISLRVFGKEKNTYDKIILDSGFTISGKHIKHIINPLEVREISKNDSIFTGILDIKSECKDKWNGGDMDRYSLRGVAFGRYKLYGYATNSKNERVLLEVQSSVDYIGSPPVALSIKVPEEYRLSGYKLSEVFMKFQYSSGRQDLYNTPYTVEGTTDTLKIQW